MCNIEFSLKLIKLCIEFVLLDHRTHFVCFNNRKIARCTCRHKHLQNFRQVSNSAATIINMEMAPRDVSGRLVSPPSLNAFSISPCIVHGRDKEKHEFSFQELGCIQ